MATQSSPVNEQLAVIEKGFGSLRERVESIIVKDQTDYIAACNLVVEGRAYVKDVKNKLGPGIDSAKTHLDFLKNQQTGYIAPVETIIKIAETKAEAWKAEERRLAQAEQDRINADAKRERDADIERQRIESDSRAAEARNVEVAQIRSDLKKGKIGKREAERRLRAAGANEEAALAAASAAADEAKQAPAPEVKVAAAVPKVAGIKGRVNYKFEVVDSSKLPREYMCPDLVKIGEMVRRIKDTMKSAALIPGIKTWEEDSI